MADSTILQITRRKIRERSAILTLTGAVLLLPPLALGSLVETRLAGVPVTVLYIFVIWLGLIVAAAALSRPLADSDEASEQPETAETDA